MLFSIPDSSVQYGFRIKPGGTHCGKTMMLPELRLLFAAANTHSEHAELRRLVTEENILLKNTQSNRNEVFSELSLLYGFRHDIFVYNALHALWNTAQEEQPLLALLCALARDSILRTAAHTVLELHEGDILDPKMLEQALEAEFPGRYGPKTRLTISLNIAATFVQSGHLAGKFKKTRRMVHAGPASAAYALLLSYLCGARGALLFETDWSRTLDAAPAALNCLAFAASQRGWISYRRIGDVVEISFEQLQGGQVRWQA